jgi:hypothetical protein
MRDRAVLTLILVNAVSLGLVLHLAGAKAAPEPAVVRAQLIELVDAGGVIRAQLKTEAEGGVVFRLMDARGEIRVKLGAGEKSSGLLLADETSEVGVHLLSGISEPTGRRDTKLVLADPAGASRVIRPGEPAR